jgi:hypothetical protein
VFELLRSASFSQAGSEVLGVILILRRKGCGADVSVANQVFQNGKLSFQLHRHHPQPTDRLFYLANLNTGRTLHERVPIILDMLQCNGHHEPKILQIVEKAFRGRHGGLLAGYQKGMEVPRW